jgi:osmotically-inducible protein OsmY
MHDTDVTEPHKYVVGRVRQALAEDPRTNQLDIHVSVTAGKLYLIGQVGCQSRRGAAEQVATEMVGDQMPVVNELWVENYQEPTGTGETA